jgi:hypothetical protein
MLDHQSLVDNQVTAVVCRNPDTLREALGIIGARLRASRPQDVKSLDQSSEIDRILWMISRLGVMEWDGPIGEGDPTFRSEPAAVQDG